ncbi:MAG: hypothetical protein QXU31_03740 [Archaeoglobaceae archaeon]
MSTTGSLTDKRTRAGIADSGNLKILAFSDLSTIRTYSTVEFLNFEVLVRFYESSCVDGF